MQARSAHAFLSGRDPIDWSLVKKITVGHVSHIAVPADLSSLFEDTALIDTELCSVDECVRMQAETYDAFESFYACYENGHTDHRLLLLLIRFILEEMIRIQNCLIEQRKSHSCSDATFCRVSNDDNVTSLGYITKMVKFSFHQVAE